MTYIATLLHQVLVVDVALDDGVLVLNDDGDQGNLNNVIFLYDWNVISLSFIKFNGIFI